MKILVIQNKMIGDVLASTVICRAIKMEFPDCEVHYMIQPNTKAVIEHNPFIDKIFFFDPETTNGFSSLASLGQSLKKQKYDAVIDAYGKWESLIPTYFSGAKVRIGFKKWYTSLFYTKEVVPAVNISGSAIYHRLQLAAAFTNRFPEMDFPKIYLLDSEISEAKRLIAAIRSDGSKIIMISVLGSGAGKSMPDDAMAETLDVIAERANVKMLFNFMPAQLEEAKAIFNLCKKTTQEKIVFDFYASGLRSFLGILSQCDALVGNEGGAVNMAKALGVPTFTIFSPWINKSSWDMLTDDHAHIAIHLQDYYPEIYGNQHPKKFKSKASELYQKLSPTLFKESLNKFLDRITS